MDAAAGMTIFALGGLAGAVFAMPFRKIKGWAYESYWLVYAVVGLILFPATLTFVFPLMTAKMPTWSIFALFGTFMVLHIFWAIFIVPETKGKALEDINL